MRGRFAPFIVGAGLTSLGAMMLLFAGYALVLDEAPLAFLGGGVAAAAVGAGLLRIGTREARPSRREALIAVVALWFIAPMFGALPFWLSGTLDGLNAVFESMSGLTATGATVIRDFTSVPRSLFLWRAFEQWLGGIGIIVLFIAVFPQLAIAGRQLFYAEAPGPLEERLTPRLRNTAYAVLVVYAGLTALCGLSFGLAGMPLFDAVAHALTTVAAGGFSPKGLSFQAYPPAVQWVAIAFMLLAGLNFALQYRALVMRRPQVLWRDPEVRAYLAIIAASTLLLMFALRGLYPYAETFRHGLFQSLSILTTSGFASVDYASWPQRAQLVLVLLMFVGGSAGSAAGGVKIIRWLIISSHTARGLRLTLHPRAVQRVRVGTRVIPEEVVQAVATFLTLYVGLFALSTALLVAFGADFITAFTAAIAAVGNVGPGLEAVGPMANFADLHPVSRGVLIFDMFAGRLEIVAVLVMLDPRWWQLPRVNLFRRAGD